MAVDALVVVGDVASEQWGLVTAAQAKARGVSLQALARLTTHGRLERLSHGVYRVAGSPPHPLEGIRAAWLALAPSSMAGERARHDVGAVVSHRSAARVHQVGDLDSDRMEFTTRRRRQTRRHDVMFHVLPLERGDWELVDGLPVTTLIRTVMDLAKTSLDGGHLAGVVRDSVVDQHVDVVGLADALDPYAHRYGVGLGRGDELVTRLLQEAGIPDATRRAVAATDLGPVVAGLQAFAGMSEQLARAVTLNPAIFEPLRKASSRALFDPSQLSTLAKALEPLQRAVLADFRSVLESANGQQMLAQIMASQTQAVRPFRALEQTKGLPPATDDLGTSTTSSPKKSSAKTSNSKKSSPKETKSMKSTGR